MSQLNVAPGPRWTWQWLVLAVPAFLVMELATRVEDRIAAGIPMMSRVASPADLIWLDSTGARGRPNARYRNWSLNARGLRSPDVAIPRPSGTQRIVVVGASETFGLYETPGREYPRQLQDSLAGRGCVNVEVVNAALPGMALPSMNPVIDRIVRELQPTAVLLYPSPAFYLNRLPPTATRGTAAADSALPWTRVLASRSKERLVSQVKGLLPSAVENGVRRALLMRRRQKFVAKEVPQPRLEQLENDLRTTIGVARSLGVPVTLIGHVNATMAPGFSDPGLLTAWEYQFPSVTGQVLVDFHRVARDVAVRVARDSSVALVDLAGSFPGDWKGNFADFVHFTDIGAARVAHTLTGALAPGLCTGGPRG
ncbi:MAG: hypothetical protein JNL26_13385 [Gemmatimonadetes bacterium]|nr:hypothetical protein [Gemmatimonadota bacterium]